MTGKDQKEQKSHRQPLRSRSTLGTLSSIFSETPPEFRSHLRGLSFVIAVMVHFILILLILI